METYFLILDIVVAYASGACDLFVFKYYDEFYRGFFVFHITVGGLLMFISHIHMYSYSILC